MPSLPDQLRRELEDRLRFESLLADLSVRFINLPADHLDASIEGAQRRICECLGLDVAVLWQWEVDAPGVLTLTHFYRAVDGPPITRQIQATESFPWTLRQVLAGRSVTISSMDDVPGGAERDRESWLHFGLKNVAVFPLSAGGGTVFGVISFHDMATARTWSEPLIKRLELVAQIFANAIVRKRFEQSLRESEERLALATEAAGAGPWVLDAEGKRFWVVPQIMELLGLPPGDSLEVERFLALVYPDDLQHVRDAMDQAMRLHEMKAVEYRVVRPDGQMRWILSRGRMFSRGYSAPSRLMGITADITERKLAEEALRMSQRRLETGAELAGLGFYEAADGENITYLDGRVRDICGFPPDKDHGVVALKFWLEHIHPDDLHRIRDEHQHLRDGRLNRISTEYRYLHPSGQQRWIRHLAVVTRRDATGQEAYTIGVLQDVTDARNAELGTLRLSQELTRVLRVATMGELVASLAHEMNQPLTAILSNAQAAQRLMMSSRPDLGEIREILADIAADDQRAGDVVSRIRSLLKKGGPERRVIDMRVVIREVVGLLRTNAILKGVNVRIELSPDPLPVFGDRIQLQQVLLNLMLNAFDAMQSVSAGGRELVVRSQYSDADGAIVAVRDTGTGIAPITIERLFEPFFTSKPDGMGMGLSICRRIIENHGGRIWAENNSDRGATFQFSLPVAEGERGASNQ